MDTREPGRVRGRLLAVVAVVLVAGALKITAPVSLPLAFAIFLIALFWPLQRFLEPRTSRGVATVATLLTCLVTFAALVGALYWSAQLIAERGAEYEQQFRQLADQARQQAESVGLSLPGGSGEGSSGGASTGVLTMLSERAFSFLSSFVLIVSFFVLGLLEVRAFRGKMDRITSEERPDWIDPARRVALDVQRYVVVRTVVGLITGVGTGLVAWLLGLDFALIWGLTNFLLNYIPTLGSIIGVVPPVLFSLVQFDGALMPMLVLLGVGGVQLLMGNYVDPLLQGKYLQLSPLVVLLSVAFWGWLWGIAGAFIGIPLTVVIAIACGAYDRTRWIAVLLVNDPDSVAARPDELTMDRGAKQDGATGVQTEAS